MRKCLRCNDEMLEDFDVKIEGATYGIRLSQQGLFKGSLGKFKCAVCPKCGYSEIYIDNLDKLKRLKDKKLENK